MRWGIGGRGAVATDIRIAAAGGHAGPFGDRRIAGRRGHARRRLRFGSARHATGACARHRGPGSFFSNLNDVVVTTDGTLYVAETWGLSRLNSGVPGQEGNRVGALPGRIHSPASTVTLPDGSLAVSSGCAVLRLTLP